MSWTVRKITRKRHFSEAPRTPTTHRTHQSKHRQPKNLGPNHCAAKAGQATESSTKQVSKCVQEVLSNRRNTTRNLMLEVFSFRPRNRNATNLSSDTWWRRLRRREHVYLQLLCESHLEVVESPRWTGKGHYLMRRGGVSGTPLIPVCPLPGTICESHVVEASTEHNRHAREAFPRHCFSDCSIFDVWEETFLLEANR